MGVKATSRRWHPLTIAAPPLLLTTILYLLQHASKDILPAGVPQIFKRDEEAQCPVDLWSPNACYEVRESCPDFNDGLFPYLQAYACTPNTLKPLVLILMLLWLPMLFACMATAAADFLAVHLEYIVQTIGISENLAGVTLFAFGNGCTDLFATLAAMGANSGSLAISELFGAAAFITTVVLACVMLIKPFSVDPRSFVGDIVWFVIAASLLIAFLADGQLVLGECLGIIGLYVAFVLFAVFRPRPKRQDEQAAQSTTELLLERYEDDADSVGSRDSNASDAAVEPDVERYEDDTQSSSPIIRSADETEASASDNTSSDQYRDVTTEAQFPFEDHEREDDLGLPPAAMAHSEASQSPATTKPSQQDSSLWRNFPPIYLWHEQSKGQRLLTMSSLPLLLPIGLTVPPRAMDTNEDRDTQPPEMLRNNATHSMRPTSWLFHIRTLIQSLSHTKRPSRKHLAENWMLCLQLLLGPQLCGLVLISQGMDNTRGLDFLITCLVLLLSSILLIWWLFSNQPPDEPPRDSLPISIVAFAVSLIWIYLTATSAVTLLMTLALILDIPTALLGATVFAVGQSSNDLVANTAVARRGMPVLAASATFGGPMMNMFIGIGGGGLVQVLKSKAAGGPGVYTFQPAAGLFVSAANLLLGQVVTLSYVFWNSWQLDRRLVIILIGIWVSFTIVNVAVSMTT